MRIALVNPRKEGVLTRFDQVEPVGLLSLCVILRQRGHEVSVHDFNLPILDGEPLDRGLDGALREAEVVGVSVVGTPQVASTVEVLRRTRELAPRAFAIARD